MIFRQAPLEVNERRHGASEVSASEIYFGIELTLKDDML